MPKIYISDGSLCDVTNMYVSDEDGVAYRVKRGYISESGVAKIFYDSSHVWTVHTPVPHHTYEIVTTREKDNMVQICSITASAAASYTFDETTGLFQLSERETGPLSVHRTWYATRYAEAAACLNTMCNWMNLKMAIMKLSIRFISVTT